MLGLLQRLLSQRWATISWDHVDIEFLEANSGSVRVHQPMQWATWSVMETVQWKHSVIQLEDFVIEGQLLLRAIYHRPAQTVYVSWVKPE